MVQSAPQLPAAQDVFRHGSQVPAKFVMPEDKRPVVSIHGESIPVIDLHNMELSEEQTAQVVKQMAKASDEWGFFQVVNHGIDVELLKKAQDVSRAFFELPLEEKLKYAQANPGFKDDGYGIRAFTSDDLKQMWRDFLYLNTRPEECKKLEKWPATPVEYRDTMDRLSDGFFRLTHQVFEFLSLGLGLPPNYIADKFGSPKTSFMTNFYPACPEPDKVLGFLPHSDFGGLTLLLQDETPGLQVLKDNAWVIVEPIPGAITINISDLLELMSNGRYKSVTHRVRANETKSRLSIASNYSCSFDGVISPAPELIDEEHPQMYKTVVFGDYVQVVATKGPVGKSYMMLPVGEKQ